MTQDNQNRIRHTLPPGRSDIYTVLMVIALLALAIGIGYVWYRSATLIGTSNPFEVVDRAVWGWLGPPRL